MMELKKTCNRIALCLAVSALLLSAGCSSKSSSQSADMGMGASPAISSMAGNFKDIEIPVEMKLDSKDSMNISTSSFQGGIVKYSGRVELSSLKEFLITSMTNNKWKLVGEASYENVLMAFTKPNKTCLVVLQEGFGGIFGSTTATMYVTYDLAGGNKLNPFGEPAHK